MLGFRLVQERLPGATWALLYPKSRRVVLNDSPEMRYSADLRRVQSFTLGHELAHGRGIMCERSADIYAGVFLVPRRSLLKTEQVQLLRRDLPERYLWRLVYELSGRFQVSATAMAVQMDALGLLRFERQADGKGTLIVD